MKAEHTGRAVYALPDCGDCGKPVSLTDRVGHQPVYHRWCAEFRWERRMPERAEDGAYRDGWQAAIVEDFDAQPPDGPNPVREAWYQGFRGGTGYLNSQRLLERRRVERCAECGDPLRADGVSRRCVCLVPSPPN